MLTAIRPESIHARHSRASTTVRLSLFVNGERSSARKAGQVLDSLAELRATPRRPITVHVEERVGANAATIAAWIAETIDPYYIEGEA